MRARQWALLAVVALFVAAGLAATVRGQSVPAYPDPYFPAPPEVAAEAAKLDGTPFELDSGATLATLRGFLDSVSGQRIHDCVQAITTDIPNSHRLMGTPTHELFLQKYANVFGELGLATGLQPFERGGPDLTGAEPDTGGTNILGVLPGRDPSRWIVVGGHYDTRELTVGGGALDNTSGICTVLELARQVDAFVDGGGRLQASVVFAWYDGEEWGLYGALAFAADPGVAKGLLGLAPDARVDVLLSQSYDMAGLNWPAKNTWAGYGDPADLDETAILNLRTAPIHDGVEWTCWSYGCYEELKSRPDFAAVLANNTNHQFLVREVAHDLVKCPPDFCWVYDDHYGRSDHIPLIAAGAPGMRIQGSHDNQFPHYHAPTDTLPALHQLAGSQELLVQGFQAEARIGGTAAFYVALTGSVGHYGYVFDPALLPVQLGKPDAGSQGAGLPLGLAALALAVAAARRRVGAA